MATHDHGGTVFAQASVLQALFGRALARGIKWAFSRDISVPLAGVAVSCRWTELCYSDPWRSRRIGSDDMLGLGYQISLPLKRADALSMTTVHILEP